MDWRKNLKIEGKLPLPTPILNEVCDRARASAGFMIEQTYLHGFHVWVRICPLINEL